MEMTQQKMTETNKNNEKLDLLLSILTKEPESLEMLLDLVLAKGSKKKKPIWRGRTLTTLPNGEHQYLTPPEIHVKNIIDELVATKKLSLIPSEAAMNKFFGNSKIRALSKDDRFFGKHYYKQYILQWGKKK